jgi:hypothetical protein
MASEFNSLEQTQDAVRQVRFNSRCPLLADLDLVPYVFVT